MVSFFQRFRITRDSDSNLTSYVILRKLCILLVSSFSVVITRPNRRRINVLKCLSSFVLYKFRVLSFCLFRSTHNLSLLLSYPIFCMKCSATTLAVIKLKKSLSCHLDVIC